MSKRIKITSDSRFQTKIVQINEWKRERITHNSDSEETLEALLQRDGPLTIYKRNPQKLMVEVYKTLNHLNPPYMWDLFTKKVVEYDFRIKILCKLPPARSQRFGTNSLKFKGSLLWNSLSDEIETAELSHIQTKN